MSSSSIIRYFNARVLRNHQLEKGDLWVTGGKIIAAQEKADIEIDIHGLIMGADADFNLLNDELELQACFIGGIRHYQNNNYSLNLATFRWQWGSLLVLS